MLNTDTSWETWGRSDPYYGVTTSRRYLGRCLSDDARAEFFERGVRLTETAFAVVERHFVTGWTPRVGVDLGCGVGRLSIPLAKRCQQVLAIDVSDAMLREARKNADAAAVTNVEFLKGDDELTRLDRPFDFFWSFHVLQHVPVHRGMRMLQQLLVRLQPEGMGVVHVPFLDSASALHRAINWAQAHVPFAQGVVNVLKRRPWGWPVMQMNTYALNALAAMLSSNGCDSLHVELVRYGRFSSAVLYFQKNGIDRSFKY